MQFNNNFHLYLGTKETLWDIPNSKNISVRDKLLEFHSKFYSSHLTYLTVLGKGKRIIYYSQEF